MGPVSSTIVVIAVVWYLYRVFRIRQAKRAR
jgi:hypothetical protein